MYLVYRPGHPEANENGLVDRSLCDGPELGRGPSVISDDIEVKSMVDGRMYTSKSRLRRSYRDRGYVEVGNEYLRNEPKPPKPVIDRKKIHESVSRAMVRHGFEVGD